MSNQAPDINEHGRLLRVGEVLQEGDTYASARGRALTKDAGWKVGSVDIELTADYRRPLHLDKPAVQEPVEKAKCVWVFDKDGWLTNLGCGENRDMRYTNITDTKVSATPNGFKFCPYCSKQIERKVII